MMGFIALMRQTLLDARWYREVHQAYSLKSTVQARPEMNVSSRCSKSGDRWQTAGDD